MFTPFMFAPVMSQPCLTASTSSTESTATVTITCFKKSCLSGNKNKKMHLSFLHTYFNILLAGIGSYLSLLYFDKNLYPLRGLKNKFADLTRAYELTFPIHGYVSIALPVCFLTIIIFHLLETKTSCCCNFCLPFTIREELSMSQDEHHEEISMSQVEHREKLSTSQDEQCDEISMSQDEHREEFSMSQNGDHEKLSMSLDENREEFSMSQDEHQEALSMSQDEHREEFSMSQDGDHE